MVEIGIFMSKTRDKLEEAYFFLKKLEEHYTKPPDNNYYLSAFIGSSRSVTWVMKHEYSDIKGWKEWDNSRKPTLEEEDLLKNINEIRIRSVKKEPIKTSTQITIDINKKYTTPKLKEMIKDLVDKCKMVKVKIAAIKDPRKKHKVRMNKRSISFVGKIDELFQVVEEFPDQDILPICRKYYLILKSLVDECEQHFKLA